MIVANYIILLAFLQHGRHDCPVQPKNMLSKFFWLMYSSKVVTPASMDPVFQEPYKKQLWI